MRGGDIEAISGLAGDALAAGCGFVEQTHEGIASRTFGLLGPVALPVRVVHDGISKTVYGAIRESLRLLPRVAGAAVATSAHEDAAALAGTHAGSAMLATLNALQGDHLTEHGSDLALGMHVRRNGSEVPLTSQGVAAAFPDATSRIAVFVHGLFENDESWRRPPWRAHRAHTRTYGDRLQDELGFTPVYVRYNTGLPLARNGRQLAAVLERLVTSWREPSAELTLVAHSTGGLVVRSACNYAKRDGLHWSEALRHVFCLGSPHLPADLEKGVTLLSHALGRLPETRALASLLEARSAGIKDLRYGSSIEEAWCRGDAGRFEREGFSDAPFLPGANYYFIAARLTPRPAGRLAAHLLNLDLLNHPGVYEQLQTLIGRTSRQPALPAAIASACDVQLV